MSASGMLRSRPKSRPTAHPGHGKRAQAFIEAFHKGDAKAVAGFWTPDGEYIDQVGQHFKGRAALEKLYQKVFAGRKGAKLAITIISLRMVGTPPHMVRSAPPQSYGNSQTAFNGPSSLCFQPL